MVEDALGEPAEGAGHAVFQHLTAKAQEGGLSVEHAAEGQEVVLVAAGAVQEEQGRSIGNFGRDKAMDES